MSLAAAERAALADTFTATGPDRPTLCEGWATRDLLAHLLVRERKPWAAPGILVPALAPITERAMGEYAEQPWAELVELFRGGAPGWSPLGIGAVDAFVNAAEFVVHHEDVRRGEPGWAPRPADATRDDEVWTTLARIGRMVYRHCPVGVVLRRPSGEQRVVTTGTGVVTITGEPVELLLHAFGRDAVQIQLDGSPADIASMVSAPRGL